ncbi:tol-Pal system protein TolR [Rubritalea halochordaticola]|uniref:Tol-Pal system protein TolR n=1 Tax=Rubritalea halochordaticola TaxID=714537 RepID=A0ABP9V008_9BACT
MRFILLCLSHFLLGVFALQAEPLVPGDYVLEMTIPKISDKKVELKGELKADDGNEGFVFNSDHDVVKEIQVRQTEKGVALWYACVERGELIVFQLTGDVKAGGTAEGVVSASKNHEIIAKGSWKFSKTEEQVIAKEIIVSVSKGGQLKLNGEVKDRESLAKAMTALSKVNKDVSVLVQAHKKVEYQEVVDVLDLLRGAGVWNIRFVAKNVE